MTTFWFMKYDGVREGRNVSPTLGRPECWSMHTGVDNGSAYMGVCLAISRL